LNDDDDDEAAAARDSKLFKSESEEKPATINGEVDMKLETEKNELKTVVKMEDEAVAINLETEKNEIKTEVKMNDESDHPDDKKDFEKKDTDPSINNNSKEEKKISSSSSFFGGKFMVLKTPKYF